MSILSPQSILALRPIKPIKNSEEINGLTGGLSNAGYDIVLTHDAMVDEGWTTLASSPTMFDMPPSLGCRIMDKSTLARIGLRVGNTFGEPRWRGKLTLELTYHPLRPDSAWARFKFRYLRRSIFLEAGTPIALVVFEQLDLPTVKPYNGRYQDQEDGPQSARFLEEGVALGAWDYREYANQRHIRIETPKVGRWRQADEV